MMAGLQAVRVQVSVLAMTISLFAFWGAGCVIDATNPYDKETPTALQADGRIAGYLVFPDENVAQSAPTYSLTLLNELGQPVLVDGAPRQLKTLVQDSAKTQPFPSYSGPGVAVPFEANLAVGTYSVTFSALDNNTPLLEDARQDDITIEPGAVASVVMLLKNLPTDAIAGAVRGEVSGVEGGDSIVIELQPVGATAQTVEPISRVFVGGGRFQFRNVPDGEYRVMATGTGYAPLARTSVQVRSTAAEGPLTDVGEMTMTTLGALFDTTVNWPNSGEPPFAPYIAGDTVHLTLDGSILLSDVGLTTEVRVALDDDFPSDAESGWGPAGSSQDESFEVMLRAVDGRQSVLAQLRVCYEGVCTCDAETEDCSGFRPPVLSSVFSAEVIRDTQGPEVVSIVVEGVATRGAEGVGEVVGIRCADFGSDDCASIALTDQRFLGLEASAFDTVGRVYAWATSIDDDSAPTSWNPIAAGDAVASWVSNDTVALTPDVEGQRTFRVWGMDRAGNISLLGAQLVSVDVTPIELAAHPLVAMTGALPGAVPGLEDPNQWILPGASVQLDVESLGESPSEWRLIETGGLVQVGGSVTRRRVPYDGPVDISLQGNHRGELSLIVEVVDAVGNVTVAPVPFRALLWRRGQLSANLALEEQENLDGAVLTVENAEGQALLTVPVGQLVQADSSDLDAPRAVFGADGTLWVERLSLGAHKLVLRAPAPHGLAEVWANVQSAITTDAGLLISPLSRGALAGRFVLQGQESSDVNNSGILVGLYDVNGARNAQTLTFPDGNFRFEGLTAGSGYRIIATHPGYDQVEVFGLVVPDNDTGVVQPDENGEPLPISLPAQVEQAFVLCEPGASGTVQTDCDSVRWTNRSVLEIGGFEASGVTAYRVSTLAFEEQDAEPAWVPMQVNDDQDPIAPLVVIGNDGERQVSVYFQVRIDSEAQEVMTGQVIYDVSPPSEVGVTLKRGPDALLDGYTNRTSVEARGVARQPNPDEAPLGQFCVLFAPSAPVVYEIPANAACGRHGQAFNTLLEDTDEGIHLAYAFSCDEAGNCLRACDDPATPACPVECSTSDLNCRLATAEASIIYDVSPPDISETTGAKIAPNLGEERFDGAAWHVAVREHEVAVQLGQAPQVRIDGSIAPEVAGMRMALDSAFITEAALIAIDDEFDVKNPLQATAPAYRGAAGRYTLYVQPVDPAGNRSVVPLSYQVEFDNVPPRVAVSVPETTNNCDGEVSVRVRDLDDAGFNFLSIQTAEGEGPAANRLSQPVADITLDEQLAPTNGLCDDLAKDGRHDLTIEVRDRAGNVTLRERSVVVDRVAPVITDVTCDTCRLHEGLLYTSSAVALMAYAATDPLPTGADALVPVSGIATIQGDAGGEVTVEGPGRFMLVQLGSTTGTRNVELSATDRAGNTGAPVSVAVTVDNVAPTGALSLQSANATPTFTTSPDVQVYLSGLSDDVTGVELSNTGTFTGASNSISGKNIGPLDWRLGTPGDDDDVSKTVYARIEDPAGNATVLSTTIRLDARAPRVTLNLSGATTTTTTIDATLTFEDADSICFMGDVREASTDNCAALGWFAATETKSLTLTGGDGENNVSVVARDAAGNVSTVASTSILLDQVAPVLKSITAGDDGRRGLTRTANILMNVTGSGASEMRVEGDVVDPVPGTWISFAATTALTLAAGDGKKSLFVTLRDEAGNETPTATQPRITTQITLDTTAPNIISFQINDAATVTSSRTVNVEIAADDAGSGVAGMALGDGGLDCNTAATDAFSPQRSWTLPDSDAQHTVRLCIVDEAGNRSATAATITLDRTPPSSVSLSLAAGSTFATTPVVSAALAATGATEMCFSGSLSATSSLARCDAGAWQPFASVAEVALSSGDGDKLVSVTFRDEAGNAVSASDSVILDTVGPELLSVTGGADGSSGMTATTSAVISVLGAGATQMMLSGDISDGTAGTWIPYAASPAVTLSAVGGDGPKTIAVNLRDEAGNTSGSQNISILLDRTAPTGTLLLDGGATYSLDREVIVTLSLADATSGVVAVGVSEAPINCDTVSYESLVASANGSQRVFSNIQLTDSDGSRTVQACVRDAAGNVTTLSDSILLDRVDPSFSITVNDGDSLTNDATVAVRLVGEGGVGYTSAVFTEDVSCSDVSDFSSFDGDASVQIALDSNSGRQTVYACVREPSGRTNRQSAIIDVDLDDPSILLATCTNCVTAADGTVYLTTTHARAVLNVVALDDSGEVAKFNIEINGVEDLPIEPAMSRFEIDLPNADGEHTVSLQALDAAGNVSAAFTLALILDRQPPTANAVDIKGRRRGCDASSAGCINDTVTAFITNTVYPTSAGATEMRLSTSATFDGAAWVAMANEASIALGGTDGDATVYAEFRDAAGNTSTTVSDSIRYDGTAPTSPSIVINSGDDYTNSTTASVALDASGATKVKVAAEADFSGASWQETSFPATLSVTLTSGKRINRVLAMFQDDAGNNSELVSSRIHLIETAPVLSSIEVAEGQEFVRQREVSVALTVANDQDVTQMRIATDGTISDEPWVPYVSRTVATLPALDCTTVNCHRVDVQIRDAAGNASNTLSQSLTLDTTAPTAPQLAEVNALVTENTVTVSFVALVTETFFARYEVIGHPASPNAYVALGTDKNTTSYDVSLSDGTSIDKVFPLRVRAVDQAGNTSVESTVIVTRDLASPQPPENLTLVPGNGKILLTWTASSSVDVTSYEVSYGYLGDYYKNPTLDGSFANEGASPILIDESVRGFVLTGLPLDSDVYVAVRAVDRAGHRSPSTTYNTPEEKVSSGLARPNPVTPQLVAELTSPNGGIPWDAERALDLVYIAERCTHAETGTIASGELEKDEVCTADNGGLRIVSIADTDNPVELSNCSASGSSCGVTGGLKDVRAVKLKGYLLYVAAGAQGVMTFDVRDPSAPTLLATCAQDGTCLPSNGLAWDVEERNGNLHVADGPAGYHIIDAGEYDRLYTDRVYRCSGTDNDAGDCAYVALSTASQYDQDGRMGAWTIPTSLYDPTSTTNTRCGARDVEVASSLVFVTLTNQNNDYCSLGNSVVKMFITQDDASDGSPDGNGSSSSIHPTAVVEVRDISALRPHRVRVQGPYVYVFDYDVHVYSWLGLAFGWTNDKARILKIDDTGSWIDGALIGDSLVAIGTQNNVADAMKIYGMSDVAQMSDDHLNQDTFAVRTDERARYGDASYNRLDSRGLHVDGSLILYAQGAANGNNASLQVLDLQTPLAPEKKRMDTDIEVGGHTRATVKGHGHVLLTSDGITTKVIDFLSPSNPEVAEWNISLASQDTDHIAMDWPMVYVAGADADPEIVGIYDLTFPANPVRLGTIDVGVNVAALEVSGHILFVGTAANGLKTYNVAKPQHPFVLHGSANPGVAQSIWTTTNTSTNPKNIRDLQVRAGTLYVVNGCGASCDQTEGYDAVEFPRVADLTYSTPSYYDTLASYSITASVSSGPRRAYVWGDRFYGMNQARSFDILGGSGELDAAIAMSDRMSHNVSAGWGIGGNGRTVYATSASGTKIFRSNFTAGTAVELEILGMTTSLDLAGGWPVGPMSYFVNRTGYLEAFDLEY